MQEKMLPLMLFVMLAFVQVGCGPVTAPLGQENAGSDTEGTADVFEPLATPTLETETGDIFTPAVTPDTTPASTGETTRVLWRVSDYILQKDSTLTEEEAKSYLSRPLNRTDTAIIFDGVACQGVTFKEETVDAPKYFSTRWGITPPDLGINDLQVTRIRTTCDLPGFDEYLRLSDRRLLVFIEGAFFFFEPNVNY